MTSILSQESPGVNSLHKSPPTSATGYLAISTVPIQKSCYVTFRRNTHELQQIVSTKPLHVSRRMLYLTVTYVSEGGVWKSDIDGDGARQLEDAVPQRC